MLARDLKFLLLLAIGLLAALAWLPLVGMLAWALGTLPHEWGHTLGAWASGRWAAPNMFFTAVPSEKRQFWFIAFQIQVCIFLTIRGVSVKSKPLMLLPAIWFLLLLSASFLLLPNAQDQLIIWSGQGGELIIPSIMIGAALLYGDSLPWVADHYRALIFWGSIVFLNSVRRWYLSLWDPTQIPFGAFGEAGDDADASNGDIDRLLNQFHWTLDEISRSYLRTAACCLVFILISAFLARKTRMDHED